MRQLSTRPDAQGTQQMRQRLVRGISGILAISSATMAVVSLWFRLPPLLSWSVAIVVAIGFALRASGTSRLAPSRFVWCAGAAMFGLWSTAGLANQSHGRPPYWLGYVTAWLAVSCVFAIVGLMFDTRRLRDDEWGTSKSSF